MSDLPFIFGCPEKPQYRSNLPIRRHYFHVRARSQSPHNELALHTESSEFFPPNRPVIPSHTQSFTYTDPRESESGDSSMEVTLPNLSDLVNAFNL